MSGIGGSLTDRRDRVAHSSLLFQSRAYGR